MANATLFRSVPGSLIPKADARSEARGPAFTLPPQQGLAQVAATACPARRNVRRSMVT
jgi:hypothetical protein